MNELLKKTGYKKDLIDKMNQQINEVGIFHKIKLIYLQHDKMIFKTDVSIEVCITPNNLL